MLRPSHTDATIVFGKLVARNGKRLYHAILAYRARQVLQPFLVDVRARLVFVRREQIDVDLERGARRRQRVGRVGNQRAQSLAECRFSF